jgi:hypothetical protein
VILPHSSDQVQPCDLSLFAAAQKILARLPKDPELDKQCQDIDLSFQRFNQRRQLKTPEAVLIVWGFASNMPMARSGHVCIWQIASKSGILTGKESLYHEKDRQIVRELWRIGLVTS